MNLNSLILTTLALAIQANAYSKRVDVYGSCEGDKYSIKMHYHRPPTMTSQDQEVLNKCNNDSSGLHGWECELSCGKGPELCEEIYEMVEKKGPAINHCKKAGEAGSAKTKEESGTKTKTVVSTQSGSTAGSDDRDEMNTKEDGDSAASVKAGVMTALFGTAAVFGLLII